MFQKEPADFIFGVDCNPKTEGGRFHWNTGSHLPD